MMHSLLKRCAVVAALALVVAAPAMAATHEVTVSEFQFTPANVDVAPGDTVHWTWTGAFSHSVTSGAPCTADGRFDSGLQSTGDFSWPVPANEPAGQIPYFCIPHCAGGMTGTITVLPTPIPTVSEWGVGVMALLVLTAGTVAFGLRRRAATVRA